VIRHGVRPRLRRRAASRTTASLALGAASLAAIALAGCGSTSRASAVAPAAPAVATPLARSLDTPAGTWATVAMGHLGQPLNTFWQLFFRPAATDRWSDQVQATAVATNGGLILAGGATETLVGIRPSNLLTFSPLISTSDAGRSWSTGLLPDGLASRPDALSDDTAEGPRLALVGGHGQEQVLESTGDISNWRPLAGLPSLVATAAGQACGLEALSAVGDLAGRALLAGSCSRRGSIGLFTPSGDGWASPLGVPTGALSGDRIEVLSLESSGGEVRALLCSAGAGGLTLVADTYSGARWYSSPPLFAGDGEHLVSIGGADGGRMFVLLGTAAGFSHLAMLDGARGQWQDLAPPPARTATVAFGPGQTMQALAVDEAVASVWRLALGSRSWSRTQVIHVPIEYGSSE